MRARSGFTLVELVVTIVVISIGVTAVLGMIGMGSSSSPQPMLRIKAVELAQSYADEIMSARWDENTPIGGGCVQTGGGNCSGGPASDCPGGGCGEYTGGNSNDGEGRGGLDDVDDYHGLCEGTADVCDCSPVDGPIRDAGGNNREPRYEGYCTEITVEGSAGGDLGLSVNDDAKKVKIEVTDPENTTMTFTFYRLNY